VKTNVFSSILVKSHLTIFGIARNPFKLNYSGQAGAKLKATFLQREMSGRVLPFMAISMLSNKKSDGYEQLNIQKSVKY